MYGLGHAIDEITTGVTVTQNASEKVGSSSGAIGQWVGLLPLVWPNWVSTQAPCQ